MRRLNSFFFFFCHQLTVQTSTILFTRDRARLAARALRVEHELIKTHRTKIQFSLHLFFLFLFLFLRACAIRSRKKCGLHPEQPWKLCFSLMANTAKTKTKGGGCLRDGEKKKQNKKQKNKMQSCRGCWQNVGAAHVSAFCISR